MKGFDITNSQSNRSTVFAEGWAGREIMVRTERFKLLYCLDKNQSQLFDLENDPYEYKNLIEDPNYKQILQSLREELLLWALETSHTTPYLNYKSPTILTNNVPDKDDGHVESAMDYFQQRMNQYYLENGQ
jgi:hypothetical protein